MFVRLRYDEILGRVAVSRLNLIHQTISRSQTDRLYEFENESEISQTAALPNTWCEKSARRPTSARVRLTLPIKKSTLLLE